MNHHGTTGHYDNNSPWALFNLSMAQASVMTLAVMLWTLIVQAPHVTSFETLVGYLFFDVCVSVIYFMTFTITVFPMHFIMYQVVKPILMKKILELNILLAWTCVFIHYFFILYLCEYLADMGKLTPMAGVMVSCGHMAGLLVGLIFFNNEFYQPPVTAKRSAHSMVKDKMYF